MKVVLFCGGLGMRLREVADNVPKPMVPLGYRPILWHLMKYYAHFGHKDFILCLGYRGDLIKQFFLDYDEAISNDFVLSSGGRRIDLANSDIEDWRITFVETGLSSNIGERLAAVRPHLEGEETFMANYADGLTDLPLDEHLRNFEEKGKIASFVAVKPNLSYHFLTLRGDGQVTSLRDNERTNLRINAGFFIFRHEVFDFMEPGDELVERPFERLMERGELIAYPYDGFWVPMDTAKDKQRMDAYVASGSPPWCVWQKRGELQPLSLSTRMARSRLTQEG
jgi:glucose-1-phosphate cytidylyltransferase